MSSIPEDVYSEILLKVPVKSLLTFKCVCKTWFSLISNPGFVKMHVNLTVQRNKPNIMLHGFDKHIPSRNRTVFYSIGHDPLTDKFLNYAVKLDYPSKFLGYSVKIMGSCDGLVCLWFYKRKLFCLWNPFTREYKVLPKSNMDSVSMFAFCYDYTSNNYKVLAGHGSLFEICSLRSNSWKNIENVPYVFDDGNQSGVLVNGDLHWVAKRRTDDSHVLISLDISNEIFKEIELPKNTLSILRLDLWVLEGRLCLFRNGRDGGGYLVSEIWVMQKYGVGESWTKRNTVNLAQLSHYRLVHKKIEILAQLSKIPSFTKLYQEEVYFESLVSLKSGTYVGRENNRETK